MDLSEFVERLGFTTQTKVAQAILYYAECMDPKSGLTPAQLEEFFPSARHARPTNVHQVLAALRQRKLVARSASGVYWLTNKGRGEIKALAQRLGIDPCGTRDVTIEEICHSLGEKVLQIPEPQERAYVEEAIRCLHPPARAFRASVLMGWTAAVYHLRKLVERYGFDQFNAAFRQLYPQSKHKPVQHFNDLEDYPDKVLLEVCERMRFFDGAARRRLEQWLGLRNGCAHPTEVAPGEQVVKAFFEEVIQYVFSKG